MSSNRRESKKQESPDQSTKHSGRRHDGESLAVGAVIGAVLSAGAFFVYSLFKKKKQTVPPAPARHIVIEEKCTSCGIKEEEGKSHECESGCCVVCMEDAINTVCVPCGHRAMCTKCSDHIQRSSGQCPMCRQKVDIIPTYEA